MAKKFVFVLLGFLFLVPINHAAPAKSAEDSSEYMSTEGVLARFKLLALTLEEFTGLYDEVVQKGPEVFTKVLHDPNVLEVKTEAMEDLTKILKDFLEKFEKAQKKGDKAHVFELVEKFGDIAGKFDRDTNELSPEATIIEKSLSENGLVNIQKSISDHLVTFLEKFSAEAEQYVNGLDEKEKTREKDFIEWFEKLKAEKDIEKKIEIIDNFIEVDDD